ncbi:MICOS complex subunit [Mycena indigotica]|uniref:MICOS complex subunit n=1 Tax=Mycena indigotica TaxID=2126181 RepID=A0A8H6T3D7_9AGAR|nr:MICOS complex subunit [Mycena indigotica]KAF7310311.1 MICOS complex subunit [Mycena indigotica]
MSGSGTPSPSKLSIYPDSPRDTLLLDTPSALEHHIRAARLAATGQVNAAHEQVQGLVSRWIGVENRVETRIKSLLPADERLVPGILYVGVAFLSGAILARHRSLPLRVILPPTFGVAAATHFNPKLTSNIRRYASDLEDEYTPGLAHTHEIGKAHTAMGWEMLKERVKSASETTKGGVTAALQKVQETTGLKLTEALGVAKEVEKRAETVVEEKLEEVKERLV